MIKYILFFVVSRYAVQTISSAYVEGTTRCNELLSKAKSADLDSARNVYCFEAVQEDQRLTLETLNKYKLGFLATNATYAYNSEVLKYACKLPWYISETLEWTAGVTPLSIVWMAFQVLTWLWSKRPKSKVHVEPPPMEPPPMDAPPKDRPPLPSKGIRKRVKGPTREEKSLMKNLNKLANLSPKLRGRIMGEDV